MLNVFKFKLLLSQSFITRSFVIVRAEAVSSITKYEAIKLHDQWRNHNFVITQN